MFASLTVACSSATQSVTSAPVQNGPGKQLSGSKADLSWVQRLRGTHRMVFDSPEIGGALALNHVYLYMRDYQDTFGVAAGSVQPVLVLRHNAAALVLNDSVWGRFSFGYELGLKDPTTGKATRRNPVYSFSDSDEYRLLPAVASLESLVSAGTIVLACGVALEGLADKLASSGAGTSAGLAQEFRDALVPGAFWMPSGIFAIARATEAGCNYVRST
jgi:hypothetical protein